MADKRISHHLSEGGVTKDKNLTRFDSQSRGGGTNPDGCSSALKVTVDELLCVGAVLFTRVCSECANVANP